MVYGNELIKVLKECEYVKGIANSQCKCFDCPMYINERPCKSYFPWWTREADLNARKLKMERKGKQ